MTGSIYNGPTTTAQACVPCKPIPLVTPTLDLTGSAFMMMHFQTQLHQGMTAVSPIDTDIVHGAWMCKAAAFKNAS